MLWHVNNGAEASAFKSAAWARYYTTNGFLSNLNPTKCGSASFFVSLHRRARALFPFYKPSNSQDHAKPSAAQTPDKQPHLNLPTHQRTLRDPPTTCPCDAWQRVYFCGAVFGGWVLQLRRDLLGQCDRQSADHAARPPLWRQAHRAHRLGHSPSPHPDSLSYPKSCVS